MQHVGNVINGVREYVLLDEQFVVYNKVRAYAMKVLLIAGRRL